jgi:uncharacterized protein (DUF1501 family)
MDRRHALKTLLAGSGLAGMPAFMVRSAWAATVPSAGQDGRMIVVFLRGAMDGLFAIAPVDDPNLATLRPGLSRKAVEQGTRLAGTGFAAHPAMHDTAALFAAGQLAFCPTAGTSDASRSHFQAQDLFELGSGAIRGDSGFMARLADSLAANPEEGAISFTREVPLAFQGAATPPQVAPLSGSGLKLPQGRVLDAVLRAHAGLKTGEALQQAIATQSEIDAAMDMEGAARGATPASGFPAVAAHLGRILRGNRSLALAFIDLGGFDTHANQEGILNRMLESVGGGLVALRDSLGPDEWARTRVVFMTEFGRTVRENGTQGTDHGHGSLFLLAGGNLGSMGGKMIGSFGGLSQSALNENRDLPVLADWRDLLAGVAASTYGLPDQALRTVFPGRPGKRFTV